MQVSYVTSMDLPKGIPVEQYTSPEITAAVAKDPKVLDRLTEIANLYLRQKDALVDARDWLWETIKKKTSYLGFETEDVKAADGTITKVEKYPEQKNINKFVADLLTGTFKTDKVVITGTDSETREASVWSVLQSWIDAASKTETDDKGAEVPLPAGRLSRWYNDFTKAPRVGKAKVPAKWASEQALVIINNKSEAKWVKNWTAGYTNKAGIKIDPFVFQPFNTVPAKDATAEVVGSTRETNLKNLAFALMDDAAQVRAKTSAEYA